MVNMQISIMMLCMLSWGKSRSWSSDIRNVIRWTNHRKVQEQKKVWSSCFEENLSKWCHNLKMAMVNSQIRNLRLENSNRSCQLLKLLKKINILLQATCSTKMTITTSSKPWTRCQHPNKQNRKTRTTTISPKAKTRTTPTRSSHCLLWPQETCSAR